MRVVVVVESFFGCTSALAGAIASSMREVDTLHPQVHVEVHPVAHAPWDLRDVDLLVVGAPTHAGGLPGPVTRWLHAQYWGDPEAPRRRSRPHGRPVPRTSTRDWLSTVQVRPGTAAAVFDTRTRRRLPGTAAAALGRRVVRRGARLVTPPAGFVVDGVAGPPARGELLRARAWAVDVVHLGRLLAEGHDRQPRA